MSEPHVLNMDELLGAMDRATVEIAHLRTVNKHLVEALENSTSLLESLDNIAENSEGQLCGQVFDNKAALAEAKEME